MTWVITGTRRGGSQAVTSRSMLMKVTASPAPTSTRPTRASGTFGLTASSVCPSAMKAAPVAIRMRGPNRSSSSPAGTCSPA